MDEAFALEQDEAAALVERLQDVTHRDIGKSTVYYGKDEVYSYFIVFPPAGEAIVQKTVTNLITVNS